MVDTGRASRETGSEGMRALWETAAALNRDQPGGGEWVPWRTIKILEDVLPREQLDQDAIERYALIFDELPPITVQRDTFTLIGGRHRLDAVLPAFRDHIRIVEVDVPDEELWERAFEDNRAHGVPMRMSERVKAAKKLLARHPDWSDERIAQWAGVSRRAVWGWRPEHAGSPIPREGQVVHRSQPDPEMARISMHPPTRVGMDGKSYPAVQPNSRTPFGSSPTATPALAEMPAPEDTRSAGESLIEAAGDPSGAVARARLRLLYADARAATRAKLLPLDPKAVAEVLTQLEVTNDRWFVREVREWVDQFEAACGRGLHVVEGDAE